MPSKQNIALGIIGAVALFTLFQVMQMQTQMQDRNKIQSLIPFKAYPDSGKAAIYLWQPSTSAAIVDDEGNRCVLVASGAQSVNASAETSLRIPALAEAMKGLDASSKSKLIDTFTKITQADSRAAALDIALFHLCLLDQNGTFGKSKKPSNKEFSTSATKAITGVAQLEEPQELKGKAKPILEAYKFAVERAFAMRLSNEKDAELASAATSTSAKELPNILPKTTPAK
jgi:hypothetical protein